MGTLKTLFSFFKRKKMIKCTYTHYSSKKKIQESRMSVIQPSSSFFSVLYDYGIGIMGNTTKIFNSTKEIEYERVWIIHHTINNFINQTIEISYVNHLQYTLFFENFEKS